MKPIPALTTLSILGLAISLAAQQSPATNPNDDSAKKPAEIRFSPDGKQLITGSADKPVRIWDIGTGKPLPGSPALMGAWQLFSFKYGDADKPSDVPDGQKRVKLITETHFTWVQYEVASGKVQSLAGGHYTLDGGAYTETIEYAGEGMTDYITKKQPFTVRVEGDKLHQSGQLSDGTKIEEVWQRIK